MKTVSGRINGKQVDLVIIERNETPRQVRETAGFELGKSTSLVMMHEDYEDEADLADVMPSNYQIIKAAGIDCAGMRGFWEVRH